MKELDRYKRDLDLIFQQLDEKEQLQRQAASQPYNEFIVALLGYRNIRELLSKLPLEEKKQVIDACWKAKLANDERVKNRGCT